MRRAQKEAAKQGCNVVIVLKTRREGDPEMLWPKVSAWHMPPAVHAWATVLFGTGNRR